MQRKTDQGNGLVAANGFRNRAQGNGRLVPCESAVGAAREVRRVSIVLRQELRKSKPRIERHRIGIETFKAIAGYIGLDIAIILVHTSIRLSLPERSFRCKAVAHSELIVGR